MFRRFLFFGLLLKGTVLSIQAQNYQALHGSSYAGSLGVANNPASIVHVPYKWDLTPVALQAKYSTNAILVKNYSLTSSPANAEISMVTGKSERFLLMNQDSRLLNTRIRLNQSSAIAFGATIRSYLSVKTTAYDWQVPMNSVRSFMAANFSNSPLAAEIRTQAWAEIFGTYAKTILDRENGILNAGITLKVNRGLGAAFLNSSGLYLGPGQVHGENGYLLNRGELDLGYSSNLDILDSAGSSAQKRKRLLQKTWSALSLSLGAEYIIPAGDDDDLYGYDLKIGVSLLDLGYNKFQYSPNSLRAVFNKGNISDSLLEATFGELNSAGAIPDSVTVVAGSLQNLSGHFKMYLPARLVLNADKRISGHFFLNAELVLPLTPVLGQKKLYVRDMNLLAVTPRFETRAFGIYLPVTYNNRNQLWVGGAVKAGPLLAGIHNFSNIFAKDKMQNGGAYLALTIRPFSKNEKEKEGRNNSNGERGRKGKKAGRYGCPANVL